MRWSVLKCAEMLQEMSCIFSAFLAKFQRIIMSDILDSVYLAYKRKKNLWYIPLKKLFFGVFGFLDSVK